MSEAAVVVRGRQLLDWKGHRAVAADLLVIGDTIRQIGAPDFAPDAQEIDATDRVTAAYDLFYEFPLPSLEGLQAAARGYREAGLRVALAPIVADCSFHQAIPELRDALPAQARRQALALREANRETRVLLEQIGGMVENYCGGLAREAHHVHRLLPGAGEPHEAHA